MAEGPMRKLTYADYCDFPDDGIRRELIDGEPLVTPSPNRRHQDVLLRLGAAFHAQRGALGGWAYIAPLDVLLSDHDVVQPDVMYVAEADRAILVDEANIRGAPTLAVEVVSDPFHDRRRKRALYARFGVREYWIVDPVLDRIEVYILEGDSYPAPSVFEPGQTLEATAVPGLSVEVGEILAR